MPGQPTLTDCLARRGFSRRAFLKYCAGMATLLGLPGAAAAQLAAGLAQGRRLPVVWLSFQECTGCTESLTRAYAPTFESLIFDYCSLDYHHTLQAASGDAAEAVRLAAVKAGGHLLIVDGSIPQAHHGACSTIAGRTNLEILGESLDNAQAVIAVGSCATFGGLPGAAPNPTGARSVEDLMAAGHVPTVPLVNIPGCPPLPEAMAATLAHFIAFDRLPRLDGLHRPMAIYANTVHDRCPRINFFNEQKFAETFDDEGARKGWCLYKLGCKGPVTHNACSTMKWNGGTSSPIDSGHPCLGCSEPGFWDQPGFYQRLSVAEGGEDLSSESAQRGRVLFDDQCVYCHEPGGADLQVPAEQVPRVYRERGGRSHRQQLEPGEWSDLVEFLRESRS